jgi:6-phosphogluconolactonase
MNDTAAREPQVVVLPDANAVAEEAARRFVECARNAVEARGMFLVALSGGSTPRALYEKLAEPSISGQIDWSRAQIFFSDERFVPSDSDQSNYHLAQQALFSKIQINDRFIHRVATENISPQQAATEYGEGMRRVASVGDAEVPQFDLVLLGLGPDGHTASLFPGTEALEDTAHLVVANDVPQQNAWRITFTYPLINAARCVMFLVTGAEKADIVAEVFSTSNLPASRVLPSDGEMVWLLDEAAAAHTRSDGRAGPVP